jgi:uncharacterized membrane protein YgcG
VSAAEEAGAWRLRSRLEAWRDGKLSWAVGRYRRVGETTLEILLDRAVDVVVGKLATGDCAGQLDDRELGALLHRAFREQIKGHLRTEAARRSVDAFEVAIETVAAPAVDAPERAVALEAARIEQEFEASLTDHERVVVRLSRAGASANAIRCELGIDRRQAEAVTRAIACKRERFEHELVTGELCEVRQRFIARVAVGRGSPRMRAVVALHAVWCPRCRPLLVVGCRQAAGAALGVLAPVPAVVGRVWRWAGSLRPAAPGSRAGELLAARLPEVFGGVGSACATAGACVLLAGGATVAVRDIAVPAPAHHDRRFEAARRRVIKARLTTPGRGTAGATAVIAATVIDRPSRHTTVRWTRVRSTGVSPSRRSSSHAARASAAARVQAARATGQFGQPGAVVGGSSSAATTERTAIASSYSSPSTGSTGSTGGASSASAGSTGSGSSGGGRRGGAQYFRP